MNFKAGIESWTSIIKNDRVTKFIQEAWLKPSTEMNTESKTNDFETNFFKLIKNNLVFGKTMEKCGKAQIHQTSIN